MASAVVNPDLVKERKAATFNPENLTHFLYRGVERTRRKRFIQNLAIQDEVIRNSKPVVFCSREEAYQVSLKKHLHLANRIKELGLTDELDKFFFRETAAPHENSPIGLHTGMFIPTIEKQGTDEQKAKYLPLAYDMKIIGTYAQTEMGHGTFIRGLETTAVYDPQTREFVLNTPKISSMKYWPGNLGKTVNYCVIMAQLYTKGKCHGIHFFVLQLRDLETHRSLPGVELGDIGPKFGYSTNDNGYLRLTNVRIPREDMLMRYSKVLEDGTYVKPPNAKLSYGSMTLVRAGIANAAANSLSQVVTIAIRYSAVRRQTEVSPGGEEAQILDYQTQQYKMFPHLATALAYTFIGRRVFDVYLKVNRKIEEGALDQLNELHAISAGIKAFTTWGTAIGIEELRMACGGHGYSQASGIPKIYTDIVPGCTYEGENTVMMLQTARYLMKLYRQMRAGEKLTGFPSYLMTDINKKSCMDSNVDLKCLDMAYEHRAARLIRAAGESIERLMKSGKSQYDATNASSVQLVWAAKAHCHAYTVKNFISIVTEAELDANTRKVLTDLCRLYAVYGITENLGQFLLDGFFSSQQVDYLTKSLFDTLAAIRPNAVAIVDAFDYPDQVLGSCLGRFDGQVYQALYDFAKQSPLNKKDVLDSFHTLLKPLRGGNSKQVAAKL